MKLPTQRRPLRIHIPFDIGHELGLGDAIKRVTTAIGMSPCSGCERRAQVLNSYVVLRHRPHSR